MPVECGEQVRVSGTTIVRGGPSAEPTTIGDRGRDVHAKPAIHPDLRRMAELERQDGTEVEEAEDKSDDDDLDKDTGRAGSNGE